MSQLELFAPAANENGVISDDHAELITSKVNGYGWDIKIMRYPDGLWRAAPDFHGKDWGFCHPLTVDAPGHPSRAYAIGAAAGIIRFHVSKNNPSPLNRRVMADLDAISAPTQEVP